MFQEFMKVTELKIVRAVASGQKTLHRSYVSSFKTMYRDLKDFANENSIFLDIDKFDEVQCLEFQNWFWELKEWGAKHSKLG